MKIINNQIENIKQAYHLVNFYNKGSIHFDDVSKWILNFKDADQNIVELWSDYVSEDLKGAMEVDCVIRALGHDELKATGDKPLDILCKMIEKNCGIKYLNKSLYKKNTHVPLKALNAAQRTEVLKGIYGVKPESLQSINRILIIDDLTTTGETISAIAKEIKKVSKNIDIYCYTVAKTCSPDFGDPPRNSDFDVDLFRSKLNKVPIEEIFVEKIYLKESKVESLKSSNIQIELTARAGEMIRESFRKRAESSDIWDYYDDVGDFHDYIKSDKEYEILFQNEGIGNEGDQIIDIIFLSNSSFSSNKILLKSLPKKEQTIVMRGVNKDNCFLLLSINILPQNIGTYSNRKMKAVAKFNHGYKITYGNIPNDIFKEISLLPDNRKKQKAIEGRLEDWDGFLEIEREFAEEKEFDIEYDGYRQGENLRYITFNINDVNTDWDLLSRSKREKLDIGSNRESRNFKVKFGSIENVNRRKKEIKIELSEDYVEKAQDIDGINISSTGIIRCARIGDKHRIQSLQNGMKRLQYGNAENENLEDFLFDSSKARIPDSKNIVKINRDLLLSGIEPNERQKKAVEGVLNAPDLFLIQGPPGTGKTTVIAEICYQVALRGGKTLIASQANLAVDNALTKLVNDPKIRPLRKGTNAEEEGKPYMEENIIATWLKQTSSSCQNDIDEINISLKHIKSLEVELPHIINIHNDIINRKKQIEESTAFVRDNKLTIVKINKELIHHEDLVKIINKKSFSLKNKKVEKILSNLECFSKELNQHIESLMSENKSIVNINKRMSLNENERIRIVEGLEKVSVIMKSVNDEISLRIVRSSKKIVKDEWGNSAINDQIEKLIIIQPKWWEMFLSLFGFGLTRDWEEKVLDLFSSANKNVKQLIEHNNYLETVKSEKRKIISELYKLIFDKIKVDGELLLFDLEKIKIRIQQTKLTVADNKKEIKPLENEIELFHSKIPTQYHDKLSRLINADSIIDFYKSLWQKDKLNKETNVAIIDDWINNLKNPNEKNKSELKQMYIDNANVIGISCGQSNNKDFVQNYPSFDIVIVDEVSKATPPELLLPILKGKKVVLVGDQMQLPPLIDDRTYNELNEQKGIETKHIKSMLFKELFEKAPEEIKIILNIQYRMHDSIMDTINQFYHGELKSGIKNPDEERQHFCHNKNINKKNHVIWVDMPKTKRNRETDHEPSFSNPAEVDVIESVLKDLNDGFILNSDGREIKDVGVITFYGQQAGLLNRRLLDSGFKKTLPGLKLRIGTVDRFQGMERPVIIVSFVRNNNNKDIGFAKKLERINVALSRAQELLIIVGCSELFTKAKGKAPTYYTNVVNVVKDHKGILDVSKFV